MYVKRNNETRQHTLASHEGIYTSNCFLGMGGRVALACRGLGRLFQMERLELVLKE